MRLAAVSILALLAGLCGCVGEDASPPAALNPAPPIRKAFVVRLVSLDHQIYGYRIANGTVPEGEGVGVLHTAGITSAPTSDPWGHEVQYRGSGQDYEFSSAGPDQAWRTADDIRIVNGKEER